MATAALITIHGMGDQLPGYSDQLHQAMQRRIGAKFADLAVAEVYYQDLLKTNERRYWHAVQSTLRWHDLRRFLLFGFADAAGLEANKDQADSAYAAAQARIAAGLIRAWQALGSKPGPIVVIAQSLGGQVFSNYLWDTQRAAAGSPPPWGIWRDLQRHAEAIMGPGTPLGAAEEAFLLQPSVTRLYTTGCNIPIFVASHRIVMPIDRPTAQFEWHNFYDRDDTLGWPLGALSAAYAALVRDHPVNAGGNLFDWLLKSWNPLSHGLYWSDNDVLRPLANDLMRVL